MRCSYSEARLDAYVDGTLPLRQRVRVVGHLGTCHRCNELLAELRVIDALLLKPRQLEPAENFTFKVMADVRPLAVPHVRRTPALPVLATYIVFAWATIGAFLWWGGSAASAMLATLGGAAESTGAAMLNVTVAAGKLVGYQAPDVTRTMAAVLAADIALAGAVIGFVALSRRLRPAVERSRS